MTESLELHLHLEGSGRDETAKLVKHSGARLLGWLGSWYILRDSC